MSVAQDDLKKAVGSERLTPGGALSLGGLLPKLQLEPDGTWQITKLASAAERARWAASVYVYLRSGDHACSQAEGTAIRRRIQIALRYLSQRGSVTHPISKALWEKLYLLTTMCAHEADWASSTGPLMGASNKTLEDRWNVTNARRSLRALAQWGFVIPFCPKGNGHRSYKKTKDGPAGAGWSLAPLRLLVEPLEAIAAREEQLRLLRLEIPSKTKAAIGAIRALLSPFRDTEDWASVAWGRLEELCKRRDCTNQGALEALEACFDAAISLLQDVENQLIGKADDLDSGVKTSSRTDAADHYQYNDSTRGSVCNGSAVGRSRDDSSRQRPRPKVQVSRDSFQEEGPADPFGITRSGFTWSEAPHLFPFHRGMIDLHRGPVNGSVEILARILGISAGAATFAERRLGRDAAAICLLLTGQHHYDGLIQKTPEAYLRGIIRKAANGELNIGHSLFGRREVAEPTPSPAH
ncbi:replication initiation protein RepC [Pseudomonas sp.]|uniref:replication initiation protein RepC n=1 Tax=Pseudomonas sp. TaxID=306 RepID=UPI003D14EA36